jgi:hypothetical protein
VTTTPPVTFDFPTWIGLFPEFTPLGQALGQSYFNLAAATIVANATTNPAFGDGNLLNCPKDPNGNPTASASGAVASQLVGRISSASEGSVSVQTEYPLNPDASALEKYLTQTRYGQLLLIELKPYWTAQYAARPTFVFGGRFRSPFGRSLWPWSIGR